MKKKFGCRVYKISIDANFTCPNRDGTKSKLGCIFCDERGSSSRTNQENLSITKQVLKNIETRKKRYRAKKFIAYFQSFTNTYGSVEKLKSFYDEAVFAHKDIVGLNISTRSDCIDEKKMKLIASYKKKLKFVGIEYGLQSIHNKTLEKINRQETFEDFLKALKLSKKYNIPTCAHIILNLPGETHKNQMETAKILSKLKVEGVKIHLLVAMKNTLLEDLYNKKLWKPYSFKKYIKTACDFIEFLHKDCILHRVSTTGHPLIIKAPKWMRKKNINVKEALLEEFSKRGSFQSIRNFL